VKKRIIALLLLTVMLLSACASSNVVSLEKAKAIALKEIGVKEADVSDLHVHIETFDGVAGYNIHFDKDGVTYELFIHGKTGEILKSGTTDEE